MIKARKLGIVLSLLLVASLSFFCGCTVLLDPELRATPSDNWVFFPIDLSGATVEDVEIYAYWVSNVSEDFPYVNHKYQIYPIEDSRYDEKDYNTFYTPKGVYINFTSTNYVDIVMISGGELYKARINLDAEFQDVEHGIFEDGTLEKPYLALGPHYYLED